MEKTIEEKKTLAHRLVRKLFYKNYATNLKYELQIRARAQAADYYEQHMANALLFEKKTHYFRYCLSRAMQPGLNLEFGVASGCSINFIAQNIDGLVHGFDSFVGLPSEWSGTAASEGEFSVGGKLPKVKSNVRLYPGWFQDTASDFLQSINENISFMHIDCDLYSSTKEVFRQFHDRLQEGSIILFDEYFNYPGWRNHEYKAFQEYIKHSNFSYEYIAVFNSAVAVRLFSR